MEYESFKELGMRELALEVLGEVPDQFVDYMVAKDSDKDYLYKGKNPQRHSMNVGASLDHSAAEKGAHPNIEQKPGPNVVYQ